ncbi:tetratricopeptide repeat protein [Corticibacter populi]|nr:tetratricopeptide repeat protein [Corticibacter populi]
MTGTFLSKAAGAIGLAGWLAFTSPAAHAQQDTADRLWQGSEQQSQQLRQQAAPGPDEEEDETVSESYRQALEAMTQSPRTRLQRLMLEVLGAVNRRDWFGADRSLRQYQQVPQHDPALAVFVDASRAAAEGDLARAIEGYREVMRSNPQFVRGELDLARALYADGRLRDAREVYAHLKGQQVPPVIARHVDESLANIARRTRWQLNLSLALVHEDNLNSASTVVEQCAWVLQGVCLRNNPGHEIHGTGLNFEATINKLWPLAGNHAVMLRSINYGNTYREEGDYDNLVSTTYLGYQYGSARNQLQLLPLFEFNREYGEKIYHAFGARASFRRQLTARAQVEASYEYKVRNFSRDYQTLEGNFTGLSLFANYAVKPDLVAYGGLYWRDNEAQQSVYSYREKVARLGVYKSFAGQATLNVAYGHRLKVAEARNAIFGGRRQRDHENSLYVQATFPSLQWQGLTPAVSYEHRRNNSTIPHAYNYRKNRVTLGFNKVF